MIYLIVRFIIPVYVIGMSIQWLSIIADILFFEKTKFKKLLFRFFISLVWPLALINKKGRKILRKSINRIFN